MLLGQYKTWPGQSWGVEATTSPTIHMQCCAYTYVHKIYPPFLKLFVYHPESIKSRNWRSERSQRQAEILMTSAHICMYIKAKVPGPVKKPIDLRTSL